ncbi:unnamed protein product [Euphydryas editha]|uniref:Sushi domain-containing protein n=1 Tax=Euphydryas editha TaxID=104508 RepID=A0AAU9UYH6_EUPED|nr:unnamed protein product [Euphydryas editha]
MIVLYVEKVRLPSVQVSTELPQFGVHSGEDFGRYILTSFYTNQLTNSIHDSYNHRFLDTKRIARSNVYDDYSSGLTELQSPIHIVYPSKTTTEDEEIPLKIHEPREDPKLFYQSDTYLKEVNGRHVSKEVASVYPGRQYIRADEKYRVPKHLLRTRKSCILCPHDRTLIAKVGVDRVILQNPAIKTCSGRKAPANIRFVHMYGPKFGTLLEHGTHVVLGRLMYRNETLHICKMQVHVIVQDCQTPKYLISHCEENYKLCNFSCRDEKLELQGKSSLYCREDMKWEGNLPVCRVRNWCKALAPPDLGQISCRGETTGSNLGLAEGTRCRIRCPAGWRWNQKAVTVCRRGAWTNKLKCIPNKEA